MATVRTPMMLLPGQMPATHEKGIRPEDERLMQWTPKTMAPKMPIVRTSPELLRAYSFSSPTPAVEVISAILNSPHSYSCGTLMTTRVGIHELLRKAASFLARRIWVCQCLEG